MKTTMEYTRIVSPDLIGTTDELRIELPQNDEDMGKVISLFDSSPDAR